MSFDQAVLALLPLLQAAPTLDRAARDERLGTLRLGFPTLRLHLLPERNEYTGHVEFGALVRDDAGASVYLTRRQAENTPWLLHQIHHFREGHLLYVDNEMLTVTDALDALEEQLGRRLHERLIDRCLVRRALDARHYDISDDELQDGVDEFRLRRGLATAAATDRWLHERRLTLERVEAMVQQELLVKKLRHELCGADVPAYFAAHRHELTRAVVSRLWFADVELARAARTAIGSPGEFALACQRALADELRLGDVTTRVDHAIVQRAELEPAAAAVVFDGAGAGAIIGPLMAERGAYLAHVIATEAPAELDEITRDLVERRLFERWLMRERAAAKIEWNWGHDDAE